MQSFNKQHDALHILTPGLLRIPTSSFRPITTYILPNSSLPRLPLPSQTLLRPIFSSPYLDYLIDPIYSLSHTTYNPRQWSPRPLSSLSSSFSRLKPRLSLPTDATGVLDDPTSERTPLELLRRRPLGLLAICRLSTLVPEVSLLRPLRPTRTVISINRGSSTTSSTMRLSARVTRKRVHVSRRPR